jgi:predicted DNA-binding transcriptional regulator YafY
MYSPTTRLLTVLELLQSHQRISGPEIARRLEVDGRTIRRYIVMLQDMGIPVEGERGPYGTYQLQRGYKLPPLMFTDAEAVALTLGLLAMRAFRFPVDMAAVEGALAKTERLMPEKLLDQARGIQEAIAFNAPPPPVLIQNDYVAALSLAVQQRHRVRLRYHSWQGEDTEREFDPYGIVVNEGYWYTGGYCHLRNDMRTFRLDRIAALEPVEASFERPEEFDVLGYVMSSIALMPGTGQVEVVMKTTLDRAQQAIHPLLGTLEESQEGVIFRRPASHLEWIAHVLLNLDFPVAVLRTVELKELIRKMGLKALQIVEQGDGIQVGETVSANNGDREFLNHG